MLKPTGATGYKPSDILTTLSRSTAADTVGETAPRENAVKAGSDKDPVDILDLSPSAKAKLERIKVDQAVADRLSEQLAVAKGKDNNSETKATGSEVQRTNDNLFSELTPSASDTVWEAGARGGDPSLSDAEFIDKHKAAFVGTVESFAPEKVKSLLAAMQNGTMKIQKGSEVDGFNTRTVVTYTGGEGGWGMSTSGHRAPTGEAKAAIESGNAIALWTEDRGDVYITW